MTRKAISVPRGASGNLSPYKIDVESYGHEKPSIGFSIRSTKIKKRISPSIARTLIIVSDKTDTFHFVPRL